MDSGPISRTVRPSIMLEAKSKDLALVRLRPDMLRYAPDVAVRFGLTAERAEELERQEATLMETEA